MKLSGMRVGKAAMAAMLMHAFEHVAHAQDTASAELTRWIFPGSESENYLRYLQTLGIVKAYPWSVRGFSSMELRGLRPQSNDHPWSGARAVVAPQRRYIDVRVDVAPAELHTWYNTAFPFGMNDGAVWAGRGLTSSVSTGASMRWGPVELTLAPIAFWAENRGFELMQSPNPAAPKLADPLGAGSVDRPQRFGTKSYGRFDLGQSGLRLDLRALTLGISTANGWWGPMVVFPYVLGNNAPGFPHLFFGTSRPLDIVIGRVHGRVIYASLAQSAFSPVAQADGRRFAGGAAAVFVPLGFRGLEIGASRFYHIEWPDSGLTSAYFTHLFETLLKKRIGTVFNGPPGSPGNSSDNQLASVFARWVLPRSGFEVFGEYGREDHNADARDLLLEPDHSATYGIGLRKAWHRELQLVAIRAEVINFQVSSLHRHRSQGGIYTHEYTRQGHTYLGQLLGTAIGVGSGAGATLAFERFNHAGFARAAWSRLLLQDYGGAPSRSAVQHVLRIEGARHLPERSMDIRWAADGVYELNHHFVRDKINIRTELALVWYR